jgi:hypothetical protein
MLTANSHCSVPLLLAPTGHNHLPLASSQYSLAFGKLALLGSIIARTYRPQSLAARELTVLGSIIPLFQYSIIPLFYIFAY